MKCLWCEKSADGDEYPVCTSCLLEPSPSRLDKSYKEPSYSDGVESNDDEDEINQIEKEKDRVRRKTDLSYLTENAGSRKNNSPHNIRQRLFEESFKDSKNQIEGEEMRMKRLYSNSLRERTLVVFNDLVLKFDSRGVALVPAHEMERVDRLRRLRPGRFTLLDEVEEPEPSVEEDIEDLTNEFESMLYQSLEGQEPQEGLLEYKPTKSNSKATKKKSTKKKSTKKKSSSSNKK